MRLFVSVDLPNAFAEPLSAIQSAFEDARGLTFTDPTQAHLTLKFLGDVDPSRLPQLETELERAVADADVDPFPVEFAGLGVFPSLSYVRVLWLGTERGTAELTRLYESIEAWTTAIGFEPDDHEFTPHVTLARMSHAGGKALVQRLVREREPTLGTTTVEAVHLTESTLTPDGPVYETVTVFPLE